MQDDPAGHYATLGVSPLATAAEITAAFRVAARRLHPDIPVTGDAAAFMRLHAAYEVLGDPELRVVYDNPAFADDDEPGLDDEPPSPPPPAFPEIPAAAWRWPLGLPVGLWAGAAGFAVLALAIGFGGIGGTHTVPPPASIPPRQTVQHLPVAARQNVASAPHFSDAMVPPSLVGVTSGYILPSGGATTLWHQGASQDGFVPAGALAAFAPVSIQRLVPQHGMVEVRTQDGNVGYVYASHLAAGDAAAAARAHCIDAAGTPPVNNEFLARHGAGDAHVVIENRRDQPAVVKLRNQSGQSAASVYLDPRAAVEIEALPAGSYRLEFAFGELWSHACGRFVAGMRAERFADVLAIGAARSEVSHYAIPPDDPVDEPDDEFNRD